MFLKIAQKLWDISVLTNTDNLDSKHNGAKNTRTANATCLGFNDLDCVDVSTA